MADEKNKPENYRAGGIKAAVWTNKGDKGTWKEVTLARAYKDKEGEWKEAKSMRISDLPKAIVILSHIYEKEVMASKVTEKE